MFLETDAAIIAKLNAIAWPESVDLYFMNPSKLVKSWEQSDKPQVALTRTGSIREDRMRGFDKSKGSHLRLDSDYESGTAVVLKLPIPKIFTVAIEIKSYDARGIAVNARHHALVNAFMRGIGDASDEGEYNDYAGQLTPTWTAGDYEIRLNVDYMQSSDPVVMDNQDGEGECRIRFQYDVFTWFFPSLAEETKGTIRYRIFEHREMDGILIRRHDPDNYGG